MGIVLKKYFGKTRDGEIVYEYTLMNKWGFSVGVLNYGGTIRSIYMNDKYGNTENVVLSYETIEEYEEGTAYLGATIGRTAGRISNGEFRINGETCYLNKNNNGNNLHGGIKGFDKVIWKVNELNGRDSVGIQLEYKSEHGEEGYPGNLIVRVEYEVTEFNELIIRYRATTDRPTVVNMTNHSYFNLSGNIKRDILNHEVEVQSDEFLHVDEEKIPTGEAVPVNDVFDLRQGRKVSEGIMSDHPQILKGDGYDHPWILRDYKDDHIKVYDEISGRGMRIKTDQSVVVIYSGNCLNQEGDFSGGVGSRKHLGICFETQNYPDGINHEKFNDGIITPEKAYEVFTKYEFFIL